MGRLCDRSHRYTATSLRYSSAMTEHGLMLAGAALTMAGVPYKDEADLRRIIYDQVCSQDCDCDAGVCVKYGLAPPGPSWSPPDSVPVSRSKFSLVLDEEPRRGEH
jgi:hypothetical protein